MLEFARKIKNSYPDILKIHRYRASPVVERADSMNHVDTTAAMEHSIVIANNERYFALLKRLGAGAYGVVKKALDLHSQQTVVVKIERIDDTVAYCQALYYSKLISQKREEAEIQLKLEKARTRIENTVQEQLMLEEQVNKALGRFHGSLYRTNAQAMRKRYLFIDYVDAQNLYEQNHMLSSYTESLEVGLQVLEALQNLHSLGYYHGDLNLWNILYSPKREETLSSVHIIDFGCALKNNMEKPAQGQIRGTHIAPELFLQDETSVFCSFTQQTEVFAAGMLLYELLTKDVFDAYRDKKFVDYKQAYQQHYQEILEKLRLQSDTPWCEMVRRMVALDPKDRPSLSDAIAEIRVLLSAMPQEKIKIKI
ncbi:MAG: protein kinase [Candidatus Berkiella sp.]